MPTAFPNICGFPYLHHHPRLCLVTPGSLGLYRACAGCQATSHTRSHIPHGRVHRVTWVYGPIYNSLQPCPIRHPEAYQDPGSWSAECTQGLFVSPQVLGWRPTLLAAMWHGYWKYPRTSGKVLGLVDTLPPSCFCDPQGSYITSMFQVENQGSKVLSKAGRVEKISDW